MICYVALLVFPFQILVWLLFNLRLFFRRLTNHASSSEALIDTLGCPVEVGVLYSKESTKFC